MSGLSDWVEDDASMELLRERGWHENTDPVATSLDLAEFLAKRVATLKRALVIPARLRERELRAKDRTALRISHSVLQERLRVWETHAGLSVADDLEVRYAEHPRVVMNAATLDIEDWLAELGERTAERLRRVATTSVKFQHKGLRPVAWRLINDMDTITRLTLRVQEIKR